MAEIKDVFRPGSTSWRLWGAYSQSETGACSMRIIWKKEMIHPQQMNRTQRQIIEATLNATVNSVLNKPEKGANSI